MPPVMWSMRVSIASPSIEVHACAAIYMTPSADCQIITRVCAMISNMPRKYELKKRAERQQATRRRIVEAAVELHRTKGPARTTLSDIARVAGVQRPTLYRHFPDERAILAACSG